MLTQTFERVNLPLPLSRILDKHDVILEKEGQMADANERLARRSSPFYCINFVCKKAGLFFLIFGTVLGALVVGADLLNWFEALPVAIWACWLLVPGIVSYFLCSSLEKLPFFQKKRWEFEGTARGDSLPSSVRELVHSIQQNFHLEQCLLKLGYLDGTPHRCLVLVFLDRAVGVMTEERFVIARWQN